MQQRALVSCAIAIAMGFGTVAGAATAGAGAGLPLEPSPPGAVGQASGSPAGGSAELLVVLFQPLSGTPDPCMPIPLCIPPRLD
jgi:hypothetical protein